MSVGVGVSVEFVLKGLVGDHCTFIRSYHLIKGWEGWSGEGGVGGYGAMQGKGWTAEKIPIASCVCHLKGNLLQF